MPENLQELFNRYLINQCTPEEVETLMNYFHSERVEELNQLVLNEIEKQEPNQPGEHEASLNRVFDNIQDKIHERKPVVRRLWPRIAAAASILAFLSAGTYLYLHQATKPQQAAQIQKQDFLPGANKAILTLANGQQIVLNNAKNGKLAIQGNAIVNKTADGKVVYQPASTAAQPSENELAYNTYSTPKGGQFQVKLADGTEVWLNDASSIKFPVKFTKNERLVTITGEVYFEVAHDKTKPFRVSSNGQTVEVLGTHFNINSYSDEPAMTTTLLEGSVRITKGNEMAMLRPGDQSQISGNNSRIKILHDVDTDEEVAWKNGFFQIKDGDIQTIMRQAARWYDVDVEYDGPVSHRELRLKMPRNVPASKFLDALSFFGVKFKIEGKKIIIKS